MITSQEDLFKKDCIRTFTGKYVNILEPSPEMFCIEDIAHSLSMQCRFNGHLREFYSVAQHSVYTMDLVATEHKYTALMHDCTEAYLSDVPKPYKHLLSNYMEVEDRLMKFLAEHFGFIYPLPEDVKKADADMLVLEWETKMLDKRPEILYYVSQSPATAEKWFLNEFHRLNPKRF